jgi:hypothetical protein
MIKNWKLWSGSLAFVFLLASCASTAYIEKDDNTDFRQYKTFAWIPARLSHSDGDKEKKDHNKTNDLTEKKIQEAVNKE